MANNDIKKIGELVKAKTFNLQKISSSLVNRGLSDLSILTIDSDVLKYINKIRYSTDPKERLDAYAELRKMGPSFRGWTDSLKNLIYNSDGWGRIYAAESLSLFKQAPNDAIPVLIALLEVSLDIGDNYWARIAAGALGNYDANSSEEILNTIPILIKALESSDYNVRGYSAKTLGKRGHISKKAIVKLSELANNEDDPIVPLYLESLKQIDPSIKSSLDALLIVLKEPDPRLRGEAVCALGKMGKMAWDIIDKLVALIDDESEDVRRFLAFSLGKIGFSGDLTIETLEKLSQDKSSSVRLAAYYGLAKLGVHQERNLKNVIGHLKSDDDFIRFLSAWALSEIGSLDKESSIFALNDALKKEKKENIKSTIIDSLEKLKKINVG